MPFARTSSRFVVSGTDDDRLSRKRDPTNAIMPFPDPTAGSVSDRHATPRILTRSRRRQRPGPSSPPEVAARHGENAKRPARVRSHGSGDRPTEGRIADPVGEGHVVFEGSKAKTRAMYKIALTGAFLPHIVLLARFYSTWIHGWIYKKPRAAKERFLIVITVVGRYRKSNSNRERERW
jgi:hypothetical protein